MSSLSPSSSFTLYLDTPHMGHLCNPQILFYTAYNHLDKHVFFSTPYPLDTISSWPHNDWSAMYYLEEVFHAKIQAI